MKQNALFYNAVMSRIEYSLYINETMLISVWAH